MELTNHIKSRYAERMADRNTTIDINTYVAQNSDKIERDISKLIEHSDIIYSGVCSGGKDPVIVRLSGTWVIIMDKDDRIAITLYKIELGLEEEFNKMYVSKWLEKLEEDKNALAERKEKVKEEIDAYKKAIEENTKLIDEYESLAKRLKADNTYYDGIIKGKNAEYSDIEFRVREDIDALTKRISF